jgi:hypothetical protein
MKVIDRQPHHDILDGEGTIAYDATSTRAS